uniref:RNA dependent RNA polymerase n=1 Tax=Camellia japonica associated betaflexivirus 1 TaxID=2686011 RepID=A0A6B9HCM7_9VIRU|nr:RNA dependent RNA polymerase [Camellia japonica associated betaflexivirus 1]
MASVMIRTPLEKFFSANDKADQKVILTSGVSYVKKYCDDKGLHFAYYLDERKKKAITDLGINLHPVPFLAHSHPFCKVLENNQLVNILPGLLGSGKWVFMSIKEGKVEQIIKKSGGVENNISVVNRCICAKDFSRYDFTPNEVDIRRNSIKGDHLFPENLMRSLKGKKIFIHDEVHHWNSKQMIDFLERVSPTILYCSVVYPPELLGGITTPQNKTFYDFKVEGDKLYFFPDGNRSEFYEQPADLKWLLMAKRFILKDSEYTVKMLSSTYCHHLIQISKGAKITESKRFFSNFDTIDLKVIHKERFRYYDDIPIRKLHLEKVYTYLMCLKKPDVESAIAKLRQLMEDEQDTRVVAFFCKFAKDIIDRFKGRIHLYETGWFEHIKDSFVKMLPNFWGRLLSRWHGVNLFEFLFKLECLCIEVELIDVDYSFSVKESLKDRVLGRSEGCSAELQNLYMQEFGPSAMLEVGWHGNLKKVMKDVEEKNLIKNGRLTIREKAYSSKLLSRFHLRVGILKYIGVQNRMGERNESKLRTLMIKMRNSDGIYSYPEPEFIKDEGFTSFECEYSNLRWLNVHKNLWFNNLELGVDICDVHEPQVTNSEDLSSTENLLEVIEVDDEFFPSNMKETVEVAEETSTLKEKSDSMRQSSSEVLDDELIRELDGSVTIIHNFTEELLVKKDVLGDGNCFYRALRLKLTGSQEGHEEVRLKFANHASHIGFNLSTNMRNMIITPGVFTETWMVNLFVNVMNIDIMIHEDMSGNYYSIKPSLIHYDETPKIQIRLLFENSHFALLESADKYEEKVNLDSKSFEAKYLIKSGFGDFEAIRTLVEDLVSKVKEYKFNEFKGRRAYFFSENESIDYAHGKTKYLRNQFDSVNELLPIELKGKFNAFLLQIFEEDGEIGFHRDNEGVYDNDNILSINLNGCASFMIEDCGSKEIYEIKMTDGLFISMLPGFQKKFRHGVTNCSSKRVNITFRNHVRSVNGRPVIEIDLSEIRNGCMLRAIADAERRSLGQVVHALFKKDRDFWKMWISEAKGGTIEDMMKAAIDLKFSFELLSDGKCEIFGTSGPKLNFELKGGHFSVMDSRPSCVERTFLNSNTSRKGSSKHLGEMDLEYLNNTNFEAKGIFANQLQISFLERTTGLILSEVYGSAGKNLELVKINREDMIEKEINFMCGFAGSGKSYSLQQRVKQSLDAEFLIICPRNELKKDWLSKLNCNEKKVRTFEVALTLNLSKLDLIIIDELGLFPNGYLDLICYMLADQGNHDCKIMCLFDPLQSRYHSDLDNHLLDFDHECDRLIDGLDFNYLMESRRMSKSFFGAFFRDVTLYNEGDQNFKLEVYDSVIVAINEGKKKGIEVDLILVASRDEKRALSCSVNTLTFGEAQGLTVNHACIVLSEYAEKQDDFRWMVALTRSKIKVSFAVMYRGGLVSFVQNNSARLIGLFMAQSPLTINRMQLMLKGNINPCIRSLGCSDEMDREERLEGDPFLKPHIYLGQRINAEEFEVFEPEVVEPICRTHIELPPENFDQSINFDLIRAREFREMRIGGETTKQFCEDFEHSRANGKRMTSGPMRYEAIYPRHKADDDVTFWMAVKKRLRFSEEHVERAKLKDAFGVGGLLYENFKSKMGLKFNWDQQLLDECVNDFEVKKLSKSKATLQAHSSRSDSDWKIDNIFLFMKSQLCTKYEKQYVDAKAGQTLACFAHMVLVKFAPYCRYMEKQLRNQFPENIYIHSGKNFNDLNDWVKRHMSDNECIESDYEAFDACQDEYILAFEVLLMEDMGMPNWFINDYIDLKCTLGCKLGHFAIMRFTGEFSTFLFNTLANMAFTFAKYDCDGKTPIAFAGDDMCMLSKCDEISKFESIFEKISLKAKVVISKNPMFCGWNLCKYGIFKEPALVYNRFMVAEERGNVNECLENYAIEVSYAYMLGEKLYEFLKEEDRVNYHQIVVRYIVKHIDKLKTKVKVLFSGKDV